jgi:uncharacterized membrane protein YebE (DUF533 family)
MADTILITASLRMEATPDYVRAQYRDIDHHIRHNVHPDIQYQWEPAGPGERKIKTTFRILGVPQFDVSLLEDAPDGSFLIRYLEGTNAGMLLVHEFVPLDGGKATEVRLRADAPSTLARKILGPLFTLGARQVMKKALHEDKADIEKGKFQPGTAAGNVARALQPLEHVTSPDAGSAVVKAACLVTTADGTIDDAERDAVTSIAKKLGVAESFARSQEEELSRASSSAAVSDVATAVGAELAKHGAAEAGLLAAATAALVSHGMSLGELELLRKIAAGAGVKDEALAKLVEVADSALMA